LSLPFYLVYIVLLFGAADAALFLAGVYVVLLWISIFNMALAFAMFNRSVGFFGLGSTLIFPLYQGVYLKCGRFFSYSSEIIFATSKHDDLVPPRVRRALLGTRFWGAGPRDVKINRLDPNVPDPVESRGARPDGSCASPMRRSCSAFWVSLSSISARRSFFSAVPEPSRLRGTWFRSPIPCRSAR